MLQIMTSNNNRKSPFESERRNNCNVPLPAAGQDPEDVISAASIRAGSSHTVDETRSHMNSSSFPSRSQIPSSSLLMPSSLSVAASLVAAGIRRIPAALEDHRHLGSDTASSMMTRIRHRQCFDLLACTRPHPHDRDFLVRAASISSPAGGGMSSPPSYAAAQICHEHPSGEDEQSPRYRKQQQDALSLSEDNKKKRKIQDEDNKDGSNAFHVSTCGDSSTTLTTSTRRRSGEGCPDAAEGKKVCGGSCPTEQCSQRKLQRLEHHRDCDTEQIEVLDQSTVRETDQQRTIATGPHTESALGGRRYSDQHHHLRTPHDMLASIFAQEDYQLQRSLMLHQAVVLRQGQESALLSSLFGLAGGEALIGSHYQPLGLPTYNPSWMAIRNPREFHEPLAIRERVHHSLPHDDEDLLLAAANAGAAQRMAAIATLSQLSERHQAAERQVALSQLRNRRDLFSFDHGNDTANNRPQEIGGRTERSCPLSIELDGQNLSQYQVMIRNQIEVFEASAAEAGTNAQGRNRPILPGQVGIRCCHCAKLSPKQRGTGAVYYPNKLDGVYQTGKTKTRVRLLSARQSKQNGLTIAYFASGTTSLTRAAAQKMTTSHFFQHCEKIPKEIRGELKRLKERSKSSDGGGKRYWAEALQSLGVRETQSGGLVWDDTSNML